MAITFTYTNPNIDSTIQDPTRTLTLRLNPYNISWNYNLNTSVYDTYGGQVIQILSVNIDTLKLDGQFGKEGAFGVEVNGSTTTRDPRWHGPVPPKGFITRPTSRQFDYQGVKYPGLYAFAAFFIEYFTVSSQGGDKNIPGQFIQIPMSISYDTEPYPTNDPSSAVSSGWTGGFRQWIATPNNIPSFTRSNEEFAPLWQLECAVVQADPNLLFTLKNDVINQISALQNGVGWSAINPWADPAANPADNTAIVTNKIVSEFKNILPKFYEGDLQNMVWQGISVPNIESGTSMSSALQQYQNNPNPSPVLPTTSPQYRIPGTIPQPQ